MTRGKFGEPWEEEDRGQAGTVLGPIHELTGYVDACAKAWGASVSTRIIACVNALDGVEEPEVAVRELVEKVRRYRTFMNSQDHYPEAHAAHLQELYAALARFPEE